MKHKTMKYFKFLIAAVILASIGFAAYKFMNKKLNFRNVNIQREADRRR
ncbi:MAG: hypothetical protein JO129_01675 [Candidatus Dependentiae bacterium]|nr:hypothetical protein [Candidatus Dependentiae bacterium]